MQFKGKLVNQTWEEGKKLNSGPDFSPFVLNLPAPLPPPPHFFQGFYLY